MDEFDLDLDDMIDENEIDADEFIDPEVEEKFQRALQIARCVNSKQGLKVSDAKVMKRFNKVIDDLKYLLDENGFDYEMKTKLSDKGLGGVCIEIEIDSFGTCTNNHEMFKNIISNTDGFSVVDLATDGVRMSFSINNAFKKVKPNSKR